MTSAAAAWQAATRHARRVVPSVPPATLGRQLRGHPRRRSAARRSGSASSAPVVVRPVGRAAGRDGVVENLVLVGRPGHTVLAGRAAVSFPGAEQELVGPAAVTWTP